MVDLKQEPLEKAVASVEAKDKLLLTANVAVEDEVKAYVQKTLGVDGILDIIGFSLGANKIYNINDFGAVFLKI